MVVQQWATLALSLAGVASSQYLLGVGIGDVTGPVVETNMMGYADLSQTDTGLHMRQRSRAFIIAEEANPANRVVLINSDIGMGDNGVRREIVKKLAALYPGVYNEQNVGLSGTHQHSGVGGYLENLLPQLTALGFVQESFDAIVDGTVTAVQRAHNDLEPGSLSFGTTDIVNGNLNRSPYAYMANPEEERKRYAYDQDKEMQLIKFVAADGKEKGFASFFAVHGTSLFQNNTLVSTDNKGMAAYLYENYVEPDTAPGNTSFVAGFFQANVGDTTPNTGGAFCFAPGKSYDGQPCSYEFSLCGNRSQECHGIGPAFPGSDYDSNALIGQYQYEGARRISETGALTTIAGPVRSVHSYILMDNYTFTLANGTTARTCKPAMGYSFAGGTTDGPGFADFYQGETTTNPFWEVVKGFISIPSEDQKACHAPKAILFNTGEATLPYDWSPHTVNVQMFRIGQIVVLLVPGELTTMAGRRLRESVRAKLISDGIIGEEAIVVLTGPANTYGHYITTREEYGIQRYEGGSTLYGPYTLEAYTVIYGDRVQYLAENAEGTAPSSPAPKDLTASAVSLRTGVVLDNTPPGKNFGDVLTAPQTSYTKGSRVTVKFQAAVPRNNLRLEGTFLTVDLLDTTTNDFKAYRTDSHPSTRFNWLRTNGALGYSEVTITWDIEPETPSGTYRITYFGDWKNGWTGKITAFSSSTPTFTVA